MERLTTARKAQGDSSDGELEIELTDDDLLAEDDELPGDEYLLLSEEDLEELPVEMIESDVSRRGTGGPPPPPRRQDGYQQGGAEDQRSQI
jgi:hypothetical protein